MARIIEPLCFTTLDGQEREFLLTMKETVAIVKRFGSSLQTGVPAEYVGGSLWECLVNKAGLTEDEFLSLLPPDPILLGGFFGKLQAHCTGKQEANEKYRPTVLETNGATNGSGSSPSGLSESAAVPTSSGA